MSTVLVQLRLFSTLKYETKHIKATLLLTNFQPSWF